MEKELHKALHKLIHVHGLCGKCVLTSLLFTAVVQSTLTKKEGMPLMTYKTVKSMSCVYGRTFLLASCYLCRQGN